MMRGEIVTATRQHLAEGAVLGAFERDVLRYMLLWPRHGTLYDEDVYAEFGMNVQQFRRRFARIVWSLDGSARDDAYRNLLDDARRHLERIEETR